MRKVFKTSVSVKEGASRSVLRGIIQYDTLNEVNIRLSDGSRAFDYTGYNNIIFKVLKADGTSYIDSEGERVIATSPSDGVVTVILTGQATAAAGLCQSVIEIYAGDGKMTTARLNYEVFDALEVDEDAIQSETEYPVLQNLVLELSELEELIRPAVEAEAARQAAEAERLVAEEQRIAAETERLSAEAERVARDEANSVLVNWTATRAFVKGNKAVYKGSTYLCLRNHTGVEPTNAAYWMMISSKGDRGEKGDDGLNAAVIAVEAGVYGFEVDEDGHLILVYEDGSEPPVMELGEDGHLYINLE